MGNRESIDSSVTPTASEIVVKRSSDHDGGFETRSLEELGFAFRFAPCDSGVRPGASPSSGEDATPDPDLSLADTVECGGGCGATRLYHDETLVTPDLIDALIPKGNFFDHISAMCQREAQMRLVRDFPLELITVYENVQALVSRDLVTIFDESRSSPQNDEEHGTAVGEDGGGIRPVASDDGVEEPSADSRRRRPTLIIMAGKGISRAGLLSVKQLLAAGMERGSAAYHIHQAMKRGWHVIILDPNAKGSRNGMDVVTKSLDVLLFFDQRPESISNQIGDAIYFLGHSASGGYLVRYLLEQDRHFQRRVAAIAFSDSTHRLSWAQRKPGGEYLHEFLQSDRALYIRNNSLGRDYPFPPHQQPRPGETAKVDHWWIQRYGRLPTVWAGTPDHSLVCWVARRVVWAFFDGETLLDGGDEGGKDGSGEGRGPREEPVVDGASMT